MPRFLLFRIVLPLLFLGVTTGPMIAQSAAGSYLAARQAEAENDFLIAADYYLDATFFNPDHVPSQQGAIRSLLASGDVGLAGELANAHLSSDQAELPALLAALAVQAIDGEYEQIVDLLLTQNRPAVGLADGLILAWAYLGVGNAEAALASFDEIAANRSISVFAAYQKALALAWMGDFEAANQTFSDSVLRGIQSRQSVIARAEILGQVGHAQDAINLLQSAFENTSDPEIQKLIDALTDDRALPFKSISDPTEGIAEVFFTIADAFGSEYADISALHYARVAQALRPDHGETLLLTAGILEELDRLQMARAVYEQIQPDSYGYLTAVRGIAETLRSSGDFAGAIEVLEGLRAAFPDDPMVHLSLGDVFRQQKAYDEAARTYSDAINRMGGAHVQLWYAHYVRGISYERLKEWTKAEADFRRSLALRPDQPQVLNYLGYSLVERREKLDEALDMIERAVSAQPGSGYIVDSLGWVYYRLGRFEEAVAPMEHAVALLPTDPIVNDHLGDVYWKVGREYEARFQWRRALSFDPEEGEADRIRRKLDVGLDAVLEDEADD